MDVDIWPSPFTNRFPIRRGPMVIGERREVDVAWILAPALAVHRRPLARTRLADRLYLFEALDGSGLGVELPVDDEGILMDYPGLFRRVERVENDRLGDADSGPSRPKISTEVENLVADLLHLRSLRATEDGGAPAPHGKR